MFNHKRAIFLFCLAVAGLLAWKLVSQELVKSDLRNRLNRVRRLIQNYREAFNEFGVLKTEGIDFWDLKTNQYLWGNSFSEYTNPKANPKAEEFRNRQQFNLQKASCTAEVFFREIYFNPITNHFDWLAEDASGTLYSPNMPDSILIASPPIRVVNIRCPLTASDPPFFEDFTKW